MLLSLKDFKCYEDKTFSFKSEPITLICGHSGAGKSTILEAIEWVLYGKKDVVPIDNSKAKTKVAFSFKDSGNLSFVCPVNSFSVRIVRTKIKFSVCFKWTEGRKTVTKKLREIEAEDYISRRYGSNLMWRYACYASQSHEQFFNLKASLRASYLCSVAFRPSEGDPIEIIQKLQKYILSLSSKLSVVEVKLSNIDERLKRLGSVNTSSFIPVDERAKYRTRLSNMKLDLTKALCSNSERVRLLDMTSNLNAKLSNLKDIPLPPYPVLIRNQKELSSWLNIWVKRKVYLSINILELESLAKVKGISSSLNDVKKRERERSLGMTTCSKYRVEYEETALSKHLLGLMSTITAELEKETTNQKVLTFSSKIKLMESKLRPIVNMNKPTLNLMSETQNITSLNAELSLVKDEISTYVKQSKIYTCPTCTDTFVLVNDALVKETPRVDKTPEFRNKLKIIETDIRSATLDIKRKETQHEKELSEYKAWKCNSENMQRVIREIEGLKSALHSIGKIQTVLNVSRLKLEYSELSSVKVLKADYALSSQVLKYKELRDVEDYLKHSKELECFDSRSLDVEVPIVQKYVKDHNIFLIQKGNLESAKDQIPDIPKQKETNNLEESIKTLEFRFESLHLIDDYIKSVNESKKLNLLKDSIDTELGILRSLKIKAEQTEATLIKDTLNFMSISVNSILTEIFDTGIAVTFKAEKTLKSGKDKREIHADIIYKGKDGVKFSQLSGGEKARLCLAFSLVQSQFSAFPFIMFDELIDSVDDTMKERCLDVIKNYFKEGLFKSAIIISHALIEGHYDVSIKL